MSYKKHFTPCDAQYTAREYVALGSCNSRCQTACAEASKCTTAVVSGMCARDCEAGATGEDTQGCCRPAFGELRTACDEFTTNCTSCSDSDACQAACNKVRQTSTCVVDEGKKYPDKCPSYDCPECVGSCGKCSNDDCAAWCDNYYGPQVHCQSDVAKSVQDAFIDQNLEIRDTATLKAMGRLYDGRCKAVGMDQRQMVLDQQVRTRDPYRFGATSTMDPFRRFPTGGRQTSTSSDLTRELIEKRRRDLERIKERQAQRAGRTYVGYQPPAEKDPTAEFTGEERATLRGLFEALGALLRGRKLPSSSTEALAVAEVPEEEEEEQDDDVVKPEMVDVMQKKNKQRRLRGFALRR